MFSQAGKNFLYEFLVKQVGTIAWVILLVGADGEKQKVYLTSNLPSKKKRQLSCLPSYCSHLEPSTVEPTWLNKAHGLIGVRVLISILLNIKQYCDIIRLQGTLLPPLVFYPSPHPCEFIAVADFDVSVCKTL